MNIQNGSTVEIDYELYDQSGQLLETTAEEGPVRYIQGSEDILPGLENALEGQAEGAELEVRLGPDEAYGPYDPEGLFTIPRNELPDDVDLVRGEFLSVTVEPEDEGAEELPEDEREMEMRIVEVHDDEVIVDINHPLAGKPVTFKVHVRAVSAG